jgi:peptidoglycan hydrolase-like protein with peptidoglycan-binding domain
MTSYDYTATLRGIPPGKRPVLRQGRTHWFVALLRGCLGQRGYHGAVKADPGGDGYQLLRSYDERLAQVVREYQTARGLTVDGVVGPQTWGDLARTGSSAADTSEDNYETQQQLSARQHMVAVAQYLTDEAQVRETTGRNDGVLVEAILENANGRKGQPWCVAAVWAVVEFGHLLGDVEPPAMPGLSCSALHEWAKDNKRLKRLDAPQPGDLYILQGGGTGWYHVGVIESYDPATGTLALLEGNTRADPNAPGSEGEGDGFYRRHRNRDAYPGAVVEVV